MTPKLALGSDSIFAGRGVAQALSRWLEQVPPGARHLTVGVRDRDSQSADILARWPLPDCDPGAWPTIATEWGQRIHGLLQDCAQESHTTAHGVVRWLDTDGHTLAARRVSVRYQGDGEEETYREANTAAVVGQLMSHQQVLMDNLTAVTQHHVVESAKRADHAYQRLIDLELENQTLRKSLEEVRAEQVSDEADRVIAESVLRDPAMERMEQLIQLVIAKWMQNQSQAKLPPTGTPDT